jgi:hypothetical protein
VHSLQATCVVGICDAITTADLCDDERMPQLHIQDNTHAVLQRAELQVNSGAVCHSRSNRHVLPSSSTSGGYHAHVHTLHCPVGILLLPIAHLSMNFLMTATESGRTESGEEGPWFTGACRRPSSSYSVPAG